MNKCINILIGLVCAFSAAAQGADTPAKPSDAEPLIKRYGLVPLPICADKKGQPVQFIAARTADFDALNKASGHKFMFGAAITMNGKPIIVYDAERLPNTHPAFQNMVLKHECMHHSLGHHLREAAKRTPDQVIKDETEADCKAIQALRDEKKYGLAEVEIIGKTLAHFEPETADPKIKGTLLDRTHVLKLCLQAK